MTGATVGALAVLAVFVGAMAVTGVGTDLLGVGALGITFGGGGIGAMLGAVLASVRDPEPRIVGQNAGHAEPGRR